MTVEPFLYNTAVEKGIVQTVQKDSVEQARN